MKLKLMLLTAGFLLAMPFTAFASTVHNVKVTVKQNLTDGTNLSDIKMRLTKDGSDFDLKAYVPESADYFIDDVSLSGSSPIEKGDDIGLTLTLKATNGSDFNQSYSQRNVSIKGAELRYAEVSNGKLMLHIDLDDIKTKAELVTDVDLDADDGQLIGTWSGDDDERYEVTLLHGGKVMYNGFVTDNEVDLTPYVTESGRYRLKVRREANGQKSEWTASDSVHVRVKNRDGSYRQIRDNSQNFTTGAVEAGWIQRGSQWLYRYPDGAYKRNGFEKIGSTWYYFDANGIMQTGWYKVNGRWFLSDSSGAMLSGWVRVDGKLYYLTNSGSLEGALVQNMWSYQSNDWYYLNADGSAAVGWYKINGSWYYFLPDGRMAHDCTVDSFVIDANGRWVK